MRTAGEAIVAWLPGILAALLLSSATTARADQYRSTARVAEPGSTLQTPQDLEKAAKSATDPYAKAMLLRELAARAAKASDYKAAGDYLQQALSLHALSPVAEQQMQADLAQMRIGSGDVQAIIATLEPQYRANPHLPAQQLVALGAAYLQAKRYAEALPLLRAGVAAVPSPDPRWRRALYAAYLANGLDREAARTLEEVLRVQPGEDRAVQADWLRLAALYFKVGDKARAQATMAVANRLGYLNDAAQRQQLVTLTAQIGAPFEAGSLLRSWLDGGQLPRNADTLRLQAALWVQARESTLAIPALEAALKAHPDRDLYLQLGQLQLDRQHYAAAAEALQQGIALGGRSGPAYLALGMALYQQADIEAAMRAFDQASRFAGSQALASQWMDYLRSGKARELALAAATEQLHEDTRAPILTTALVGGTGGEPPAPQSGALAPAAVGGLTPIGAERAGSADGVIPAWNGGLPRSRWPAGFHAGGHLLDPFAGEAPLFTITAANASRYAQWLTPGQLALFERYPDYFMKVYPTHRTVAYPQAIEAATQANIGHARTLAADSLADAHLGFPFPRPKTGVEVLWNHRVRYRGDTLSMQSTQAVVWPDGTEDRRRQYEQIDFRYANLADPIDLSRQNILLYYLTWFSRAGRGGADYVLVHETANQLENARAIWVIPQGIPRLFRVPPVGYDQPFPGSAGMQFVDMVDMYNGLFDRYVWKLIGKREIYIPYNDYRLSDGSLHYDALLTRGHFNQAAVRYERHRVWVVEATLRPGYQHRFGKRLFYVDEDSWNVVEVDNYDHDGQPWRIQEGHLLPDYEHQTANCAPILTYDLKDGRYFASRLLAEDPPPRYNLPMRESDFNPATVQARYAH